MAKMADGGAPSPYVGLQPFREGDNPYFFGRESDIRVISSNLREQPLTIVYGASGVGKSSALRAGVLPHLLSGVNAVAVYFNAWQSETFLDDLQERCRTALHAPEGTLDKVVSEGRQTLFLILDQFEEYLLYHRSGVKAEAFDALLARIVNRDDLAANVLIGIREDALSAFDQRFSIRIADLLANTLPLEHLNSESGRRAIVEPLRVFNELHALGENGYSIERELTEEILRQVQPRKYAEGDGGAIGTAEGRIETPFLQLVLKRLWDEEVRAGSRKLRLASLKQIGGARQIVEKHVNEVLANLPRDEDREIAACMFRYLVTPSRSKIAQDTESLIGYGEAAEAEVRKVLAWLSDKSESRILRRLDAPERYEIFHDVLAQPILDWRKNHFAVRERIEEARKRRQLQILAGVMLLLAIAAVGFGKFALEQRGKAREAADLARIESQQTLAAKNDAQAAHAQADAAAAGLQANQAELAGRKDEALRLRAIEETAIRDAVNSRAAADQERSKAASLLQGQDQSYRDAAQQLATIQRERDQLKTDRDRLQGQVNSLSTEVTQLRSNPTPPESVKPVTENVQSSVTVRSARIETPDVTTLGPDVAAKFIIVRLALQNRSRTPVHVRRVVLVWPKGTIANLANLTPQSPQLANIRSSMALSKYLQILADSTYSREDAPWESHTAFFEKSVAGNVQSVASVTVTFAPIGGADFDIIIPAEVVLK
jgi:hypothetical protein